MMVSIKITPENYSTYWPQVRLDRPEVRYDLDLEYHRLYDVALAATQMKDRPMRRQRHYLLRQLIEQLGDVPGDAAEVGCFRGLSAYVACASFLAIEKRFTFHIFDSFEGLSPLIAEDQSQYLPQAKPGSGNPFACSEEQVRANLNDFSFVAYHKGWVPDGFEQVETDRFCFVHIDVDLYQPTRDAIAFFWPRLSPGGVVVLDDYGTLYYPGARQALTSYLDGRPDAVIVETTSGAAVAVKLHAPDVSDGGVLTKHAERIRDLATALGQRSVLALHIDDDIHASSLSDLQISGHDLRAGKRPDPQQANLVLCVNVLERLPRGEFDQIVRQLRRLTLCCAFVVVRLGVGSMASASKSAVVGEQTADWWRARIEPLFSILEWDERDDDLVCVLAPLRSGIPKVQDRLPKKSSLPSLTSSPDAVDSKVMPVRHLAYRQHSTMSGERTILVVLGAHHSGVDLLAKLLGLLGANIADGTSWTSDDVSQSHLFLLHHRVLEAIERPLGSPLHALPFPSGWWRRRDVQNIKREMKNWLSGELSENSGGHWGLADPLTARLLPLWLEIFRELNLEPRYVVAVRSPEELPSTDALGGEASLPAGRELVWLAYNYDIFRYVGMRDPLTLDFNDWACGPLRAAQTLAHQLDLPADLSEFELAECVSEILHGVGRTVNRTALELPLSLPFYHAVLAKAHPEHGSSITRYLEFLDVAFRFADPYVVATAELPALRAVALAASRRAGVSALEAGRAVDLSATLVKLRVQMADAEKRSRAVELSLEESGARLAEAEEARRMLADEKLVLQRDLTESRVLLDQSEKTKAALVKKASAHKHERAGLLSQLERTGSEITSLLASSAEAGRERERLAQLSEKLDREVAEKNAALSQLRSEYESARVQANSLKNKSAALNQEFKEDREIGRSGPDTH